MFILYLAEKERAARKAAQVTQVGALHTLGETLWDDLISHTE